MYLPLVVVRDCTIYLPCMVRQWTFTSFSFHFMQEKTEYGIKKLRQSTGFGAKKNELLNCCPNFQSNHAKKVLTSIFSVYTVVVNYDFY